MATSTPQTSGGALLVGAGALGTDIGLRLAELGHHPVVGIRRRADLVPPPLVGLSADLAQGPPELSRLAPDVRIDLLAVALTAKPRTEEAYRATYVEGLCRALDALTVRGDRPRRAVLVSSTAVYGVVAEGSVVDETTPARPADGRGRALLEAEHVFTERLPHGTVLRLSGLYGHGTSRFATKVMAGGIVDPDRWTNRIHRDDAAAAVVHLLTREEEPDRLYIGTDDEPAPRGEVAGYLAHRLDAPRPPAVAEPYGKRLSNARLRATGWTPAFPTYREGYREHPARPGLTRA